MCPGFLAEKTRPKFWGLAIASKNSCPEHDLLDSRRISQYFASKKLVLGTHLDEKTRRSGHRARLVEKTRPSGSAWLACWLAGRLVPSWASFGPPGFHFPGKGLGPGFSLCERASGPRGFGGPTLTWVEVDGLCPWFLVEKTPPKFWGLATASKKLMPGTRFTRQSPNKSILCVEKTRAEGKSGRKNSTIWSLGAFGRKNSIKCSPGS